MALDLSKLTPAPWLEGDEAVLGPPDECFLLMAQNSSQEDCKFTALARNAFDIMMRRKWSIHRYADGWRPFMDVANWNPKLLDWMNGQGEKFAWPDPFTALVEPDAWLQKQERNHARPPVC